MKLDKHIKTLISSKKNWDSETLLGAIDNLVKDEKIILNFYDESDWRNTLTYDITVYDTETLKKELRVRGIFFDRDIEDLRELAESIEDKWWQHYLDLGGNGWIDYD